MKVYVVYCTNIEEDYVTNVFKVEKKAREFVDYKNKTEDDAWFLEEWEVEE